MTKLVHIIAPHVRVTRLLATRPVVLVGVPCAAKSELREIRPYIAWWTEKLKHGSLPEWHHLKHKSDNVRLKYSPQEAIGLQPIQENSLSEMLTLRVYLT